MALRPETEPLVKYFEVTYIGFTTVAQTGRGRRARTTTVHHSPTFPPGQWSVYQRVVDEEPRTNNQLEGWHRRFSGIVGKAHPNVHELLQRLREEQSHTEIVISQLVAGQAPKSSRAKYQSLNKRIKRIVDQYYDRPLLDYLKGLALNITYQSY